MNEDQLIRARRRMMRNFTCPHCGGSGQILKLKLNGEVTKETCHHPQLVRIYKQVLTIGGAVSA